LRIVEAEKQSLRSMTPGANRQFLSHLVCHVAYRIVHVGRRYALQGRNEVYGTDLALDTDALSPENIIVWQQLAELPET
jgi:hypothetical protein